MATPNLALIPSAYKARVVYSVLPNNGVGDFTFVRSGNATRINKDGLIETVDSHVPRLNYDLYQGKPKQCPSLLLEPSSTNLVTFSEDFSGYTTNNSSISSNVISSPDGSLSASKLIENTATAEHTIQKAVSVTSGNAYSISVFVKKEEISSVQFGFTGSNFASPTRSVFDIENGTITTNVSNTASIENYGNGWYKLKVTNTTNATGTAMLMLQTIKSGQASYAGDGVSGFYMWGLQWEQQSYATSYIPTSGSTETRNAEVCEDAGNSGTFNDSEGVLMVDFSAISETGRDEMRFLISNGTNNERVQIGLQANNTYYASVVSSNTASASFTHVLSKVAINNKLAISYKTDLCKFFINGFEIGLDISATMPTGLDRLDLYRQPSSSNYIHGNTKQIQYFDSALTDSQLEYLTSYRSFGDMVESQNYIIQ